MIYEVIDHYDIWGNAKDGYEVNDSRRAGEIELDSKLRDEDILKALFDNGLITLEDAEEFEVGGDDTAIYIDGPGPRSDNPPVFVPYYTLYKKEA